LLGVYFYNADTEKNEDDGKRSQCVNKLCVFMNIYGRKVSKVNNKSKFIDQQFSNHYVAVGAEPAT
jgi:hypothetical protein